MPLSQDNSEVHFKVRQTTKFEKVRSAPDPPVATSWASLPRPPARFASFRPIFSFPPYFRALNPSPSLRLADLHGFLLPQVASAGCRAFPL